jgi:myosin-crossreactive antigen
VSFTTTLHDPDFFRIVRDFTGNVEGEGGLVTFAQSSWLMSIALPHQPHFAGQPEGMSSGPRLVRGQARRLREEADVGLHRPRNHDRGPGTSAD